MMIKNGKVYKSYKQRAEAAEARAADLAESNRELAESVTTLRASVAALTAQNAEQALILTEALGLLTTLEWNDWDERVDAWLALNAPAPQACPACGTLEYVSQVSTVEVG